MSISDHSDAHRRTGVLFERLGSRVAFVGVLAPLALIGVAKFSQPEVEALRPLIGGTPWLSWMYDVFGVAQTAYILGVVELATAVALLASPLWRPAGVVGGAMASITFLVTSSLMLAVPIWDPTVGFPVLGPLGQFLIKDVCLLGVAIVIMGRSMSKGAVTP